MIVLIVFIVVLEQGSSTLSCHFTYRKLNSHACICRLNLAAKKKKNTERRTGLCFDRSMKSSDILKDFLIIQKRKLKMTYFLLKQQVWGHGGFTLSRNFSRELEFDLPRIKADTHEGFCSWSKAPPCVPRISWVYSVLHPREQNPHPAKCSTIFNWLNIWEQAPRAN